MRDPSSNHYARAFESWLVDNHIKYVVVDQQKRAVFSKSKIKSFDFLLYPKGKGVFVAEVKGRKFKGGSFAKLTSLSNWVTMDDVEGLRKWQQIFGSQYMPIFVFVYALDMVDVESDGREIYDFGDGRYVFFAVRLDEYRSNMTLRSPKWRTVNLPAKAFRNCAISLEELLLK